MGKMGIFYRHLEYSPEVGDVASKGIFSRDSLS
jgi:hypothetical protein